MSTAEPVIDRVLLTNDDGIDAPGLRVLEVIASQLAREVWVVAPETDQSGTSHSVSLHGPLRVIQRGERRFGVTGTPGDCVAVAARHLMRDAPPDLVLSGVNRGGNLGVETVFSGTVGAAMTGMLLGIRSLALSQVYTGKQPIRWESAETLGPGVLRRLLATPWDKGVCLNINFPDVDPADAGPMQITQQGAGLVQGMDIEARLDPRSQPYLWLRFQRAGQDLVPDSETAVVRGGGVSVTPLRFERTDDQALARLREALG
jgi:5'-nucleotidase